MGKSLPRLYLTHLYQTLVEPTYSALPSSSYRAKPRTQRDVQSHKQSLWETSNPKLYSPLLRLWEGGKRDLSPKGGNGHNDYIWVSAAGERLLLMLAVTNHLLAFYGAVGPKQEAWAGSSSAGLPRSSC